MQTTTDLIARMRANPPRCPVCDRPVDPDAKLNVPVIILIPLDDVGDRQGMLVVHKGCESEAKDRLRRAQAVVELRRVAQGTEHPWDKAKRLEQSGEAVNLDAGLDGV